MDRYDTAQILNGLQELVAGRGEVVTRRASAGRLEAILIPTDASHAPIAVHVVGDECLLRFGSGSRSPRGYGGPGDEDIVLDAVRAIISGNAWERFVLADDGLHVLPRIVGERHESVAGDDDLDVLHERRIPAWPRTS